MTRPGPRARAAVFFVAALAVAFAVAGLILIEVAGGDIGTAEATGAAILAISFVTVGAIVTAARGNAVGWVMLVAGCFNAINAFVGEYSTVALDHGLPLRAFTAWLYSWVWVGGALGFPLVLLLFPTGRPPSRRWWAVAFLAVISGAVIAGVNAISAWSVASEPLTGPEVARGVPDGGVMRAADVAFPVLGATLLAAAASLIVRYRRGSGVERQQIKLLFFAGALVTFVLFTASPSAPVDLSERVPLLAEIALVGLVAIPGAIGIAILRYRLYDIGVVVNKTLVYLTLTALLTAAYLGIVFGLQAILPETARDSDLAVAASTLAVAALFRPLRARIQHFIDKRFYRSRFDAHRTLEAFSSQLRDEVDLAALSSRLTEVVAETMQPVHVSLWVRSSRVAS